MQKIHSRLVFLAVLVLPMSVLFGCGDHNTDLDAPALTMNTLFDQNANPSGMNTLFVVDGDLNLSGTVESGAEVEVEVHGDDARPATVVGETWTYLLPNEDLEEGVNSILITAKDETENQTSINFSVTKDTTGPEITLDQYTTPEPTGSQTLAGTVEAGAEVFVAIDGGPEDAAFVSGGGWSYELIELGPGSYSIMVFGIDAVGNETETPPVMIIDIDPAATVVTVDPVPATTAGTVSLAGTRSANVPLVFDPIETGGDISDVDLSLPENWTATFSDLDSGFNLLSITAGVEPAEAETRILVHRDRTGPRIVANTPGHGATVPVDSPITVTFDEDIDEEVLLDPDIQALVLRDSGDDEIGGTITYNSATWTAAFVPDVGLSPGETFTVTVDADIKDLLGNRVGSNYRWTFDTANP